MRLKVKYIFLNLQWVENKCMLYVPKLLETDCGEKDPSKNLYTSTFYMPIKLDYQLALRENS